jgi:hypothetical protein
MNNELEALEFLWNYRNAPAPNDVPHFFEWLSKERLLRCKEVSLPFAGAVLALCTRHPDYAELWRKGPYGGLIDQSQRITNYPPSKESRLWCEMLIYRWFVLARDKELWDLLLIAHNKGYEGRMIGAQAAIAKVCAVRTPGSEDTLMFDDFRCAVTRLAREFSKMTWEQRGLPFDKLPFSVGTKQVQKIQNRALLPAHALVQ